MKKLFLFIFLIGLAACSKKPAEKPVQFPVKIETVIQKNTPFFVKGVGQLEGSVTVDIKPQATGILTSVLFEDGALVEEGDLLMVIDPRPYEADVQQAQARLEVDKARLKYALDFAETYGSLVGKAYVSRLDFEQGVQNVDVFKANIENDLAAIKKAQVFLEYTTIRAPFKGYIGKRAYDPGNYVEESATQTQPLVSIRKVTPLSVNFSLPSQYVQEIREQQKIEPLLLEAVLPDDLSHPMEGTLILIDNKVNDQTGMIFLKGTLPNLDERGWPGQFVRVYLRLKTIQDAILVPTNAIVLGQSGHYVFVVDEKTMTVTMRMVGSSFEHHGHTVVDWGLKAGEKVVSDGQLNLYDGVKVFIPEEKTEKT